jgi:hypothetical protein
MKVKIIVVWGIGIIAFAVLLGAAVVWDAERGLRNAHELVLSHDREVQLQEERFFDILAQIGRPAEEFGSLKKRFQQAQTASDRETAFHKLLIRTGEPPHAAPDDPVARRAADEYAGALNRRQIALRRYKEVAAEYDARSQSWQGRLARNFSDLPEQITD